MRMNHIGEISYNKVGSKMIIINYYSYKDMDVYFEDYNWTYYHARYDTFKNGQLKCPYEPRAFGIGFLGEGKYTKKEYEFYYTKWHGIIERVKSEKYHNDKPTYIDVEIGDMKNFQIFCKWMDENYYTIPNETMCVDKDILFKNNKLYDTSKCCIVPNNINVLFTKNDSIRGECPIGVSYSKTKGKFMATCSHYDFSRHKKGNKHLGYFNNEMDAFELYKTFKENEIKYRADYYKDYLPQNVYEALYNYEVEIND